MTSSEKAAIQVLLNLMMCVAIAVDLGALGRWHMVVVLNWYSLVFGTLIELELMSQCRFFRRISSLTSHL